MSIRKSKIGQLSAKKGEIYPQIRLPPQLTQIIGEIEDVFEAERNGKRAFLLVTKQSMLDDNMVVQPGEKVVKSDDKTDNDRRFKSLESQISELKSLLLLKARTFTKTKKRASLMGSAGFGTSDLRHVKARFFRRQYVNRLYDHLCPCD